MEKKPFATKEQLEEIAKTYPTPFYLYDEKGIRENARKLKEAFAWNPGFKEYFAVKATPNPFILKILKEMGCGTDCSSQTELMMSDACGFSGHEISLRIYPLRGCSHPCRSRHCHQNHDNYCRQQAFREIILHSIILLMSYTDPYSLFHCSY